MRILITGAGGFIGMTLTDALLKAGKLADRRGELQTIEEILLLDTDLPPTDDPRITRMPADIADPATREKITAWRPSSVFHLATMSTNAAERDPGRAFTVNVAALADLIATVGDKAEPPRLVFSSSISVFGGLLPDNVDDDHLQRPQTSYGSHKAMAELMLTDATRHGVIDARALRIPILLVHPQPSAQSVSDRISGFIRDAVAGKPATCPLRADSKVPVVSAATVVRNLITLHNADTAALRGKRVLNQPGLTVSMEDIVRAIDIVTDSTPQVTYTPDPELKKIVDGWPKGFISTRAPAIGIVGDKTFDEVIMHYLRQLGKQLPAPSAA